MTAMRTTAAVLRAYRYALTELRAAVLSYVKSTFFLMHRTSLGGGLLGFRANVHYRCQLLLPLLDGWCLCPVIVLVYAQVRGH